MCTSLAVGGVGTGRSREEGRDALTTAPGSDGALAAHMARACAYCGAKWGEGAPKGDDCDEGECALSEATTGCGA